MSLYGALFAGVAGINAQSNKLGIISDNIANVNTVGYKQGQAVFETLVVNASNNTAYSPGGVLGGNQQLIDQQGLLQSTNSPTDIAISGGGLFVVNQASDGSGQILYTRAGSFTQDKTGNFKNAAGLFLQAWPLDRNGNLPGDPGNLNTVSSANLTSLRTVNVQSLTGTAGATTSVSLGANLNAGQAVFPGAGKNVTMDATDTLNSGIKANDIIVPTGVDLLSRGDTFNVSTGSGLSYNYSYGGFTFTRDVTDATVPDNNQTLLTSPTTLTNPEFTTNAAASGIVTVTQAAHGLQNGDVVTISGDTATVDGITPAQLNGTFVVSNVTANTYDITTAGAAIAGATSGGAGTVVAITRPFVGNILDANTAFQPFLGITGTAGFTQAAQKFTITTAATGTVTFTYTSAAPNIQLGQFNNMTNLADAISSVPGLTARVANNRLFVAATDGNAAVTFANGSTTGVSGPPVQSGIDWVRELGLANVSSANNRYSTMSGLASLVNNSPGVTATVSNPLGTSSVLINVDDPLDTVTFADRPIPAPLPALAANAFSTDTATNAGGFTTITISTGTPTGFTTGDIINIGSAAGLYNGVAAAAINGNHQVTVINSTTFSITVAGTATSTGATGPGGEVVTPPTNTGSPLAELGLGPTLNGVFATETTGALGPAYDPTNAAKNMSSGVIAAQFSRPVTVFDALGTGHNMNIGFLKTGTNTWAVEVFASPATDVSASGNAQISYGTITFNGDGSLRSVGTGLSQPITINWTNGAAPSTISFNWGTAGQPFGTPNATVIGKTDGLSQFNSAYNVAFVNQNGAPVGQLVGVQIDKDGFVIANYSNGQNQKLFRIPLASFADPNQLQPISGNAYAQTSTSGEVNLRKPGASGVGTISPSTLEASNVELANQLTDMIVAQRAYQANTKVISTADTLLDDLDQILR